MPLTNGKHLCMGMGSMTVFLEASGWNPTKEKTVLLTWSYLNAPLQVGQVHDHPSEAVDLRTHTGRGLNTPFWAPLSVLRIHEMVWQASSCTPPPSVIFYSFWFRFILVSNSSALFYFCQVKLIYIQTPNYVYCTSGHWSQNSGKKKDKKNKKRELFGDGVKLV